MAHLCNKGSVLWPPQESAGVETSCVSIPGGLGPDLQCKHQREGMSPQPQWTMSPHPSSPLSSPPTISWEHRAGVIHHCIITIFQVNWGWVNKIRAHSKLQKKANLSNVTVCSCRSESLKGWIIRIFCENCFCFKILLCKCTWIHVYFMIFLQIRKLHDTEWQRDKIWPQSYTCGGRKNGNFNIYLTHGMFTDYGSVQLGIKFMHDMISVQKNNLFQFLLQLT